MPLAPEDSGGPVMDDSGALIGISVQGRLRELNTLRLLNHSGISHPATDCSGRRIQGAQEPRNPLQKFYPVK